jgi:hypothetical protein
VVARLQVVVVTHVIGALLDADVHLQVPHPRVDLLMLQVQRLYKT